LWKLIGTIRIVKYGVNDIDMFGDISPMDVKTYYGEAFCYYPISPSNEWLVYVISTDKKLKGYFTGLENSAQLLYDYERNTP